MTSQTTDFIIIGGGIIGTALLDRLSDQGYQALLLEREEIASGATGASLAMLGVLEPTSLDIEVRQEGATFYHQLVEENDLTFGRCGYLHLARSKATAQQTRDIVALAQRMGESVSLLTAQELREIVPGLDTDAYLEAGYSPNDGYLDGHELAGAMSRRAQSKGAQVRTASEVTEFLFDGDTRIRGVRTDRDKYHARHVIVAMGPWTWGLLNTIDIELPLTGVPGQILVVHHNLGKELPMMYECDTHLYLRGEGTQRVLFGELDKRSRSDGGVQPHQKRGKPAQDFVERAIAHWTKAIPAFKEGKAEGGWVGLRTVTPDRQPVIGPLGPDSLWVSTGFSGHGIQLAPAAARMLADAILENKPIPDVFVAGRFAKNEEVAFS